MAFSKKVYSLIAAAVTAAALFIGIYICHWHEAEPAWTFAFYLDGSGNLLIEQQRNLREIIQGSRMLERANVVVYLDRGTAPAAPMIHAWKGKRIFHVSGTYSEILSHPVTPALPLSVERPRFTGMLLKGLAADEAHLFERHYVLESGRYVLKEKGPAPEEEQAMVAALQKSGYLFSEDTFTQTVSTESISRFFSLVRDNYPARHYAFFIAGHGVGWSSLRSMQPSSEKAITQQLNKSFYADAIKKGLIHNEPEILCLDLCLMADLQTLYQLRQSAAYLVLGQGPMPAGGQDYRYLFQRITAESASRPEAMARAIFASSTYALDKSKLNSAITLIRTGPGIDAFITGFVDMIMAEGAQRIAELQKDTYTRLPRWGGQAHEMIDLKSFIEAVRAETGISGPDTSAFVLSAHSTSKKASGLSIYYPQDAKTFLANRDEYAGLDFNEATGERWLEILDLKHGRGCP